MATSTVFKKNTNNTKLGRVLTVSAEKYIWPKLPPSDKWKILRALYWMDYEPFNQVNDAWNSGSHDQSLDNSTSTSIEPLTWYLIQPNINEQYKRNVLILSEYFLSKQRTTQPRAKMCVSFQHAANNKHWYWIEWILSHYQVKFNLNQTTTTVQLLHGAVSTDSLNIVKLLLDCTNINISATDIHVCAPLVL